MDKAIPMEYDRRYMATPSFGTHRVCANSNDKRKKRRVCNSSFFLLCYRQEVAAMPNEKYTKLETRKYSNCTILMHYPVVMAFTEEMIHL